MYSKIVSSWKKWTEDSGETSLESQICSITETLEKMGILQGFFEILFLLEVILVIYFDISSF